MYAYRPAVYTQNIIRLLIPIHCVRVLLYNTLQATVSRLYKTTENFPFKFNRVISSKLYKYINFSASFRKSSATVL